MQPSQVADPVKHPTVKLGDNIYPVKFRLSDLSDLWNNHQIDLFIPAEVKGIAAIERVAKVLSAGLAHVVDISPEEIMKHIEVPELPIYALAIVEAQKKASPESERASKALEALASPKKSKQTEPDKAVQ